jgi:hypothetical protein
MVMTVLTLSLNLQACYTIEQEFLSKLSARNNSLFSKKVSVSLPLQRAAVHIN